jgi:hypothetical protein
VLEFRGFLETSYPTAAGTLLAKKEDRAGLWGWLGEAVDAVSKDDNLFNYNLCYLFWWTKKHDHDLLLELDFDSSPNGKRRRRHSNSDDDDETGGDTEFGNNESMADDFFAGDESARIVAGGASGDAGDVLNFSDSLNSLSHMHISGSQNNKSASFAEMMTGEVVEQSEESKSFEDSMMGHGYYNEQSDARPFSRHDDD